MRARAEIMRITDSWIGSREVQGVLGLIERGGHSAYLVGGCVRNAMLGLPVTDIDVATDARPERVAELARAAELKVVPTGIDHGTVTVITGGQPFEVTTFRRDVETDGRRAVVAFADRLEEDAARRDFTMNALYADRTGQVFDPVGGAGDLLARQVRFVGDPSARIAEDYLRILRFFRFHAVYGDPARGLDAEALAACAAMADGVERLSRERVGQEMRKLLAARDPAPALAAMQGVGVLHRILPGADARAVAVLVHLDQALPSSWIRRLAALGGEGVADRLRLSRAEARALSDLRTAMATDDRPDALGYRFGAAAGGDAVLLRAALSGRPPPDGWRADVARGADALFPVTAADLAPLAGADLGERLAVLERRWLDGGLRLTRDQLLA
jgi:poly(A) polymerase